MTERIVSGGRERSKAVHNSSHAGHFSATLELAVLMCLVIGARDRSPQCHVGTELNEEAKQRAAFQSLWALRARDLRKARAPCPIKHGPASIYVMAIILRTCQHFVLLT